MILSFVVYTSLAAILFALGWHVSQRENRLIASTGKRLPFYAWELILMVLAFAFIAGARFRTGFDHEMYLHQYNTYQRYGFFTRDFEPLFILVTSFFSGMRVHYFFYFFFWGALQFFFLTYACRHRRELLPWMALNVMLGFYFYYLMNSIREGVVASLFLAVLPMIAQRKFLAYCLVALLLAMLHKSAIMMIPFFFLGMIDIKPYSRTRSIAFLLVALSVLLGMKPLWLSYAMRELQSFHWFAAEQYQDIIAPVISGEYNSVAWGPLSVSILLTRLLAIWYYPVIRQDFKEDKILPIVFVFFVASCMVSYLLKGVHHLFLRPFDCLMLTGVLMYAYVALYLYRRRNWLMFSIFCLSCYSCCFISIAKAALLGNNERILYHFFFL